MCSRVCSPAGDRAWRDRTLAMLPCLTYLTIFRSRLGGANVVLGLVTDAFTPEAVLQRRLRAVLLELVEVKVDSAEGHRVLAYLTEKRLIGASTKSSGRYRLSAREV